MSVRFARVKFVRRRDIDDEICIEAQAWDDVAGVKAMATPDFREMGLGPTEAEAKKDAMASIHRAYRDWVRGI